MKIAVMGTAGRMGRELVRAVVANSGCSISGGTETAGSAAIGKDMGELAGLEPLDVVVSDDVEAVVAAADAIVDFTAPAASLKFAELAARHGTAHVLGTTGFDSAAEAAISECAKKTVIVKAGNMSLGVNLLLALTRQTARALGPEYDIEIVEMHHRMKVDAPSGTALMLGEAAAAGRNINLAQRSVRVRDGHTGARQMGDIGFATLRGGSVVGEHAVIFAGDGETIEIRHCATDRGIFARGAVRAAVWANGRAPGLYTMVDVLSI